MPGPRFDPIWHGHRKNYSTLLGYLKASGRAYYLSLLVYSAGVNWAVAHWQWAQAHAPVGLLIVACVLPPLLLAYHFAVYKEFWYVLPKNPHTTLVMTLYSVWLLLFLVLNITQILTVSLASLAVLFTWGMQAVTFGQLLFVAGVALAVLEEFFFSKFRTYAPPVGIARENILKSS